LASLKSSSALKVSWLRAGLPAQLGESRAVSDSPDM